MIALHNSFSSLSDKKLSICPSILFFHFHMNKGGLKESWLLCNLPNCLGEFSEVGVKRMAGMQNWAPQSSVHS